MNEEQKKLVESYISFPHWIMNKNFRGIPLYSPFYEEMIQEGYLSLCTAAEKFDPSITESFSSYAYKCCWGKMNVYYNKFNIGTYSERKDNKYIKKEVVSLDYVIFDEHNDKKYLSDIISYDHDNFEESQLIEDLLKAFNEANEDYGVDILKLKLLGYKQIEIGNILGMNQSYVSRIIAKAYKIYKTQ